MHRIGILSDTHGVLRAEVLHILSECEIILHSGDVDRQDVIERLNQIAPTYVVRGNADKEWAIELPDHLFLEFYGLRFFMTHNKKMVPRDVSNIDIIVYGHSHKYEEKYIGRQLWLNPGSCGTRRLKLPVTMAVLEISDENSYSVKKIDLQSFQKFETLEAESFNNELPQNIKQVIVSVMKDTDRGITVEETAKRNKIDKKLADQICRLYLTHPGVTADGIMRKMGL